MIAVDTNILVYAHRREMPLHDTAVKILEEQISDLSIWSIPWPCLHEFIAVVTNPRIFKTPTPLTIAFEAIKSWQQGNNLNFIGEGEGYLNTLEATSTPSKLSGTKIHDARIAAICLHHGIKELWSCDRDFSLFPKVRVVNPLV